MYTLGERVRYVRENILRLNQARFANTLGFSRVATISDYETNKRLPDITSLRKVATVGGVSLEWLLTGKGSASSTDVLGTTKSEDTAVVAHDKKYALIKVYGKNDPERTSPVDCMLVPIQDAEASFALRIEDDSMSPTILNGAVVGIGTSVRNIVSGSIYVVRTPDKGLTIRRAMAHNDRMVLTPDNPAYPDTVMPSSGRPEKMVIGRVVWLYQRY